MTGFTITDGKGFHITFANGWTVSVQFGGGNYCEHYRAPFDEPDDIHRSKDAEISVFKPDGSWTNLAGSEVYGYATPEQVALLLAAVAGGNFVEAEMLQLESE
jgi:hypothetical protein